MISLSEPSQFNSSEIPTQPGVYLFKNSKGEIIYIGKAKNLRARVRSYFSKSDQTPKTRHLIARIRSIEWIIVFNEVEALLLENKLVKKHKPKYNINLKDAKTFAYIAISKDAYPRIFSTRKPSSRFYMFGPYTEGYLRRELQRLVVKIFRLRTCKKLPKRACLNFHIGLCTAPCENKASQEQYKEQVEQARSFLMGKYEQLTENLTLQMDKASKEMQYERALELRNQIASIQLLTQRQVVDSYRKYDQDVIAFRRLGDKTLVVQMGVRKGVLLGKKEYTLDFEPQIEQMFLKEFYDKNRIPQEILLNTQAWADFEEKTALEEYFATIAGAPVNISIPTEGDELYLMRLAEKNIEANLDEDSALVDLQTELNLPSLPRVIECFDVSNLGKEHVVSGMVRFIDGSPDKSNYRRFKIKTVKGQDDFASMQEAVTRRYRRLINEDSPLPDLIVVDGGPGQVSSATSALKSLGLQVPIIGLAKKYEEIFLPEETVPRRFKKNIRMMLLLRKIRDAAHNFSISYSRKRKEMQTKEEFNAKHN
ncbi:MAG: excinuclease ABC subunit UvrC [Candidatus Bathyarchaeum tardum]|nr:MAG: excinuclease ABC subunit UvrC [Candidatus Bathyarchaeum tardum]